MVIEVKRFLGEEGGLVANRLEECTRINAGISGSSGLVRSYLCVPG